MKDPTLDELIERFKGWEGPEVSGEVVYKMNTTDKLAKALRALEEAARKVQAAEMDAQSIQVERNQAHEALAAYDAVLAATPAAPQGYVAVEIYAAWRRVGADVAGLKWDDFVEALRKGKESGK